MKVLLQRKTDGRFLSESGEWIEPKDAAKVFPASWDAAAKARELEEETQVVFSFEDERYNFVIGDRTKQL